MGRIFTVDFTYGSRTYTAIVKISSVTDAFSMHINVPDTTLHHLVPEGNIVYHSLDGITSVQQNTPATAFELIDRVVNAVKQYLAD